MSTTQTMNRAIIWSFKSSTPAQHRQVPSKFQVAVKNADSPILRKDQIEILPDAFFTPFNKIRGEWDKAKRTKYIPLRSGALVSPNKAAQAQRHGHDLSIKWSVLVNKLAKDVDEAAEKRRAELVNWGEQQDWSSQKLKQWKAFVKRVVPDKNRFVRYWTAESFLTATSVVESDDPDMVEASRRGIAEVYESGVLKILEDTAKWANERIAYAEKAVKGRPMNASSVKIVRSHLTYLEENSWVHPSIGALQERLSDALRPVLSATKVYGKLAESMISALEPVSDMWDLEDRYYEDDPLYPVQVEQDDMLPVDRNLRPEPQDPKIREFYLSKCMEMVSDDAESDSTARAEHEAGETHQSESAEASDEVTAEDDIVDLGSEVSFEADEADEAIDASDSDDFLDELDPSLRALFGDNTDSEVA